MSDKEPLKLYKVEQLLVVHWKMQTPLAGSLDFLLNEQLLPKPFLAVQMASALEMFIIADASIHKLTARKNRLCIRLAESEKKLSEVEQGAITLLPRKLLLNYSKAVQARFFTRLLQHTRQRFEGFEKQHLPALIKRYAYPVKELYQVSDKLFFIRLPWELELDKKMLPLTFGYVDREHVFEQQKQLGLWLDGALHLFVNVSSLTGLYGILSYGTSVNIPLSFTQTEKLTRKTLLDKLSLQSSAKKTLASFLLPMFEKSTSDVKSIQLNSRDFKGHVLGLQQQCVIGWAQNSAKLSQPVQIGIYENKKKINSILANQDCQQLGFAQPLGQCGFALPLADEYLKGEQRQIELVYAETGELLPGGSIKLGDGQFDVILSVEQGIRLKGSFQQRTLTDAAYSIQLYLDDELFSTTENKGGQVFELLKGLPEKVLDSQLHVLQVNIVNAANKVLYSKGLKIQHKYQGALEQVDFGKIRGWVFNHSCPERPVAIDIVLNDKHIITEVCERPRVDVQQKLNLVSKHVGFEVDIPEQFILESCLKIELYFSNSKTLVLPQQTILTPKDTIIRSLVGAAEYLKSSEAYAANLQAGGGMLMHGRVVR